jgi:DNA-binding NarL/FixJ family response regulator
MAKRILIADDYPLVRQALRGLLEALGYCEVVEAENGEDAVTKTQELKPDLVVLDLAMPKMDGLRAARAISLAFPQIPIIMHTLHASPRIRVEAMKAGVHKLIAKSDSATILAAVHELLRAAELTGPAADVPASRAIPLANRASESCSREIDPAKAKTDSRRPRGVNGPADQ